jgi:hypothetical protein
LVWAKTAAGIPRNNPQQKQMAARRTNNENDIKDL